MTTTTTSKFMVRKVPGKDWHILTYLILTKLNIYNFLRIRIIINHIYVIMHKINKVEYIQELIMYILTIRTNIRIGLCKISSLGCMVIVLEMELSHLLKAMQTESMIRWHIKLPTFVLIPEMSWRHHPASSRLRLPSSFLVSSPVPSQFLSKPTQVAAYIHRGDLRLPRGVTSGGVS